MPNQKNRLLGYFGNNNIRFQNESVPTALTYNYYGTIEVLKRRGIFQFIKRKRYSSYLKHILRHT